MFERVERSLFPVTHVAGDRDPKPSRERMLGAPALLDLADPVHGRGRTIERFARVVGYVQSAARGLASLEKQRSGGAC